MAGLDGAENIPIYNTTPLTKNEELQLLKLIYQLGLKFDRIGKIMGNRSPAALKNLYFSKLRKKKVVGFFCLIILKFYIQISILFDIIEIN